MKKVLLVLAAVVLVTSGVAAVSAYEAHVINVRSHVENVMTVPSAPVEFGTVFPEEWIIKELRLQHSSSFCWDDQWRVTAFNYSVWVEWKTLDDNGTRMTPTTSGWGMPSISALTRRLISPRLSVAT